MTALKTVAFLGRDTGLTLLKQVLIPHPDLDLNTIFTHQQLPKKEGGGDRPEYADYVDTCQRYGVQLTALDFPQAKSPQQFLPAGETFDVLIMLSWRYLLPSAVLKKFKRARINIHRGALPKYAGAEPIKRAIETGETKVAITAHHVTETLDAGATICSIWQDIAPLPTQLTAAAYAETVKQQLKPLYAPLTRQALQQVLTT